MADMLQTLSGDLDGKTFATHSGVRFRVVKGEHYPEGSIAQQHNRYLNSLPPGLLVSASFHAQPVPVITLGGGVVRLVEVEIDGVTVTGAREISTRLGVQETRQPVGLQLA